jgi:hypothetical protein
MNLCKLLVGLLLISCSISACSKDNTKTDNTKKSAIVKETPKAVTTPKIDKKPAPKVDETTSKSPTITKRVYFTSPTDKAEVTSPVKLVFGVDGMTIRPALEDTKDKSSGHHHLIIDGDGVPAGTMVPMDPQHIHYGKGQTSAMIELKPGTHSLRLQFADGAHLSYGPEMSSAITVTVK